MWFFLKWRNSFSFALGQNQHPPLSVNSYIGDSKSYFLHNSNAMCSVYPYFSNRLTVFFVLTIRSILFFSSTAIPTYCVYSPSTDFQNFLIGRILQSLLMSHFPVIGNPFFLPILCRFFVL